MANLGTLGTFWWITVLGWFLSPIITLLVNKLFAYLVFDDASKKLRELEMHVISDLKRTVQVVEEKRMVAVKYMECQPETLYKMNMDLKSALYEAEDILDLVDYYRIKKGLGISWVKEIFHDACQCIRCKFRRWIKVTQAALVECAQIFYHLLGRFIIHLNQQRRQLFRCVTLRTSDVLLPVSGIPSVPAVGAADPPLIPEEEVREAVEEIQEEDEDSVEEMQEEDEYSVEEIEEEEKGEEREVVEWEWWSRWTGKLHCHHIWHYVQSIKSWLTGVNEDACYYRDWSYRMVGVESVQVLSDPHFGFQLIA